MKKTLHLFDIGKINVKECESQLEKERDDFASGFAEWVNRYKFLPNNGWFHGSYQLEMGVFSTTKELLEIYKQQL